MKIPRRAFTLIELLTSIAVCAVLVAILIPALAGAREQARRGRCLANLRTIATYCADYLFVHRELPDAGDEEAPDVRCPSARLPDEGGYPWPTVIGSGFGQTPATTFFGRAQVMDPAKVSVVYCWRHEPKPVGFLDGHAR